MARDTGSRLLSLDSFRIVQILIFFIRAPFWQSWTIVVIYFDQSSSSKEAEILRTGSFRTLILLFLGRFLELCIDSLTRLCIRTSSENPGFGILLDCRPSRI